MLVPFSFYQPRQFSIYIAVNVLPNVIPYDVSFVVLVMKMPSLHWSQQVAELCKVTLFLPIIAILLFCRFSHHVFSYNAPTLLLISFDGHVYCVAVDSEWRYVLSV